MFYIIQLNKKCSKWQNALQALRLSIKLIEIAALVDQRINHTLKLLKWKILGFNINPIARGFNGPVRALSFNLLACSALNPN